MKYLKVVVSVSLLGILLYKIDWKNIYQNIHTSDLPIITVVFMIMVIQFPVSAYRWKKSLAIHELNIPFLSLQKILCIGFFINTFLPTSIGGDGYRALKTMPGEGEKSRSISAILLERILGFLVLLIMGLLGALFLLREYRTPAIKMYILGGVLFGIFIFLAKMLIGKKKRVDFLGGASWMKKFDAVHRNLQLIKNDRGNLLRVVLYSIVFQLLAITSIYLMFKAVGVEKGIADCAFIAAFAGIATVLPISINGIGVVEGSLVFSAAQVGIAYDQAILVALTLRILTIPLTLACGFIYLYDTARS